MPILVDAALSTVADGRSIRIAGVPDFNAGDPSFKINVFEGWFDTSVPDVVLVSNGGGAGAVAVGEWEPAEHYYTLVGRIDTGDLAALPMFARLLKAGLPADQEVSLVCLGNDRDVDLQVFVRRYDKASLPIGQRLDFTFPLVAPDPYKYALEPLTGEMGVFTGQSWFRTYDPVTFTRTYTAGVRTYEQAIPSGPYPPSLTLASDGDAASPRVVFTINGPVTAGDWWILNETTGRRLWVDVSVTAGQSLVLDCQAHTARLNGAPVDHLVFGDWVRLVPGPNTYRLVSGTASDAFASVSALPAYQ